MNPLGRILLGVVALLLLAIGLVRGSHEVTYLDYPDTRSCGSAFGPTTFIVAGNEDPAFAARATRCAAEIGRVAPQVWASVYTGGGLLVVLLAVVAGSPSVRRRPGESGRLAASS